MRKTVSVAVLGLFLVSSLVALVAGAGAGEGKAGDREVILIHDVYELQNMSNDMNASCVLANDIDASATKDWNDGRGFLPIADPAVARHWSLEYQCLVGVFNGEFDGRGHTISNLYINQTSAGVIGAYAGLFYALNSSARVLNLTLASVDISGGDMTGGLAGRAEGASIYNCHVSGKVAGTGQNAEYVGMLVGLSRGTIDRCSSEGSVVGRATVGGLVGASDTMGGGWPNALVRDSFSHASATADPAGAGVGGLAAMNTGAMRNCYSTGAVCGTAAGGLVGYMNGTVTNCYWDTVTSAVAGSAGGTGKPTAEMKKGLTFAAWDFDNVWAIDEDATYPYFRDIPAPANRAPTITTVPPTTATVGSEYSVRLEASDPDGDTLSWSISFEPQWLQILDTDLLYGIPQLNQTGTHVVALTVSDGRGGTASITFELTVSEGQQQHPPAWSSVPSNTTLVEGADFKFTAAATDIDAGDVLVYGLTTSPACGLTMNAATGALEWLNISAGEYVCVLTATDGHSVISHVFGLRVVKKPAEEPKILTLSGPENVTVKAFSVQTFSVEAKSPTNATLTYEWKDNGVTVSTEKSFSRKFAPGNHTLILLIGDGKYTTTRTFNFTVAPAPKTIGTTPAPIPGFEAGIAAAAVVSVMAVGLFWRRERR